ncbi:hypothetical protein [Ensifer sp. SSB1]|uniref:hypothetical protein n=1 Tax=Ensifer sp. SSB1 TaxID=2795385 RepID=UPI001A511750|nr:hypothetical protein [Ensifer sp. SSB1]MBK5571791.1 hypothetical protein [Ensifer sp. SSB1]
MLKIRLPRPVDEAPEGALLAPDEQLERRAPEEVVMWRCAECFDLHHDEDDAADCCDDSDDDASCGGMLLESGRVLCPCCGTANADFEDAVECCLWKTIGPAERQALAQQMRIYGYLLDSALVGMVTGDPKDLT